MELKGADLVGKRVRYYHAGEQEYREGKVIRNIESDLFDIDDDITSDIVMDVYIFDIKEVID